MPAIGEAAAECQLFDVEENLGEGLRPSPQLDLSQAGGVDDEAAAGHLQQLAMAGGVAPLAALVHISGAQHLLAEQAVDQGGFPDARRSPQHGRLSPGKMQADRLDPGASSTTDGDHRHTSSDRFQLRLERVRAVEIDFGQRDHGRRPALIGHRQQPLDAAQVEIGVRRGGDEDEVHVGGDDLRHRLRTRCLPRDGGLPWQHGADLGRCRRMANGHPIANRDQPGLAQGATERGQWRASSKLHEELGPVVGRQPPGLQVLVIEGVECGSESLVPAELFQLGAVV